MKPFTHGVSIVCLALVPATAAAQQCPPPEQIDKLRLEAAMVRAGESVASVANRALQARAAKAGTDPKLLATVANALAFKPADQSAEEAAAAAAGFVVPAGILAAGACLLSTFACIQDAREFEAGCLSQSCPSGSVLDQDVCLAMAASDLQNCTLTCGTNGPDGDADRACVDAPSPPRVPPFVPPTFIPPPFGGGFVACTDAEVTACEIQSGTYTDSSNGDIIDRECTLYDMSGNLSRCMCQCVEVVAVSSEMVFETE